MSNQLAENISESLSGNKNAVITMGGVYYTVKPPVTRVVALLLKPLSHIQIDEDEKNVSVLLKASVDQYGYADECIAICILGNRAVGLWSKIRLWRLKHKLSLASDGERIDALNKIVKLIVPSDFFVYSRLAMELTGTMTRAKQK